MEQTLILVDGNDKVIGYAPRKECHSGDGKRHRAFLIALYNKRGEILLQERRHWLWDRFWDLTATSHPLHAAGKDEGYIPASERCLKKEWGISGIKLENVGSFDYFARHGADCENEHCVLVAGEYLGEPRINPEVAYGFRWVALPALIEEVRENPQRFTPWLIEALPILKRDGLNMRPNLYNTQAPKI